MNQYYETAIKAYGYVKDKGYMAEDAWEKASREIIKATSSQKKSCPRCAFLGLFPKKLKNPKNLKGKSAVYAQTAVGILKSSPDSDFTADKLWERVMKGENKTHNQQMNVVLALWDKGFRGSL